MSTIKSIVNQTNETVEFQGLIEVYQEIAAGKMRRVKHDIISTRDFFDGLGKLSIEVGSDFQTALEKEIPQEAAVLITANAGLYGDIIEKTLQMFTQYIRLHKAQVFVIGRMGKDFMEKYMKNYPYKVLLLPDDKFDDTMLRDVVTQIVDFPKISVFYGKFQNLVIQRPHIGEISGKMFPSTREELELMANKRLHYLYEPSVYSISEVFTKEVFRGVLEQMILESQLAKFASRIMHLDRAIDKINEHLVSLNNQKTKAKKQLLEKKQNETIVKVVRM